MFQSLTVKSQLYGTYTIGKSGTENYPSIMSAIVDCYFKGTSAAVTFKISPGVYTEQLFVPFILGPKVSAPLTFEAANGDSTSVVIKHKPLSDTANYTLIIDGAEYIIFKKLSFTSDTVIGRLVEITRWCQGVQFYNCRFLGWKNGAELIISPPANGNSNSYSIFINNEFINGTYGISMSGNEFQPDISTYIQKNTFKYQSQAAVYLKNHNQPIISGNTIFTENNDKSFSAIFLEQNTGKGQVSENKIFLKNLKSNHYGIRLVKTSGLFQNEFLISNNFIACHTDNYASGIFLNNISDIKVFHNSVHISGNAQGANAINMLFPKYSYFKNNIFSNATDGVSADISGAISLDIDYNAWFSKGDHFITIDNMNLKSLKAWQDSSGMDKNSVFTNPMFCTDSILFTYNPELNGKGIFISQVNKDIELQSRSNPPDIGADEFIPLSFDLGNEIILCSNKSAEIDAGSGWDSYLWSDNSTNQKISITPAQNENTISYIHAKVSKRGCFTNDSIKINQKKYPVFSLGNDTSFCWQKFSSFTLKGPSGYAFYRWQNNNTDSIFQVSKPADSGLNIYWLEITDSYQCRNRDSIRILFYDCSSIYEMNEHFVVLNNSSEQRILIKPKESLINNQYLTELYDMNGKIHFTHKMAQSIDVSGLTKGIYILKISYKNEILLFKLKIE